MIPFADAIMSSAGATGAGPQSIGIARLLTDRADLPEAVIARAQTFQTELDPTFPARLSRLAANIAAGGLKDREAVIAHLSGEDQATALQLIAPLYLGYTGTPQTAKDHDNAKFVTFLDALMYECTTDVTIRPSYARGGRDYWTAVPEGVVAPAMPADIAEWGARNPKAAPRYATPDPRYLAMSQGRAKTATEAAAWLAANAHS